ncbi:MAG: hypothetical protein ABFD07_16590 [Methanobacterium sp.]
MTFKKPEVTEKSLFNGCETTTISIEVPMIVYTMISEAYRKSVANGITSLTFEQYAGVFLQTGVSYNQYTELKKVFEK